MAGRIVEFFGLKPLDPFGAPYSDHGVCPFVQSDCIKPRHGGCALEQKGASDPVIICPNRLYADGHAVLLDVARQAFGPSVLLTTMQEIKRRRDANCIQGNEVAVFGKYWGNELSIPQPGDEDLMGGFYIDYVLARLNPDGQLSEFTAVEVQTIDTTGTYKAQADAFFSQQHFIDGQGNDPGWTTAGLNWANVSKRILPQLIYKGYVLRREALCHKGLFFVCPSAVLRRIFNRLGGKMLDYPLAAGTITFQAYDLGPAQKSGTNRTLVKGETFTTTVEQVAYAFVSPVNLPNMGVYEKAVRTALE